MATPLRRTLRGGVLALGLTLAAGTLLPGPTADRAAWAAPAQLTGRVDGRVIALSAHSPAAQAVQAAAIAEFQRCDDTPRMRLESAEMPAYRAEEHLELAFAPPEDIPLPRLAVTLRAVRLLVPLGGDRTRPDWFFYGQEATTDRWDVYRQRGVAAGHVEAFKALVRRL